MRFSVIICVKDRLERLRQCLETFRPLTSEATGELIIVCDGGPPEMRTAAASLLNLPNGWECHWMDVPAGGPARARNAALARIQGELILFLNDDVRMEPGLLSSHHRHHLMRPGHAVMGNTRWAPEVINSQFMHWVAHHDSFYYLIPEPFSATWEYFHTMNVSVDRKWFDEGARFEESFPDPAFEDTELGYRLWKQGLKITLAYDAILWHVHEFTPAEYLSKSRMRGRSAHRFLQLHPELTERILLEYQRTAGRLGGWRGRIKALIGRYDTLEVLEARIGIEFLRGYREAGGGRS